MTSESLAPSELVMLTSAARPTTETEVPAPKTSMMSSPLVPLTMTMSAGPSPARAADRAGEVDVDLDDVGAGQVVDGDGVGAAERVEVDASRRRSRSMTMLPRLRVNRTRPPLAEAVEDLVAGRCR